MPFHQSLSPAGSRLLRLAALSSFILLLLLGGSLTARWSARARAQERAAAALAGTGLTTTAPPALSSATESESAAATTAAAGVDNTAAASAPEATSNAASASVATATEQSARQPAYTVTWERTLVSRDGQSRRLATTTRYQRADGSFKLVHTFDAPAGSASAPGGKVYFGLTGLGYFRVDDASRTLVFTTPAAGDDEPGSVAAFLRAQPQFDREEDVRGQRTIVWRMADQESQVSTEEWRAPALGGLLLKRVVATARGRDSFEPTEITLGDPPPGLFAELSGYAVDYSGFEATIREMERDGNRETARAMRQALSRMRDARPDRR